jgi:hypothetical protein
MFRADHGCFGGDEAGAGVLLTRRAIRNRFGRMTVEASPASMVAPGDAQPGYRIHPNDAMRAHPRGADPDSHESQGQSAVADDGISPGTASPSGEVLKITGLG